MLNFVQATGGNCDESGFRINSFSAGLIKVHPHSLYSMNFDRFLLFKQKCCKSGISIISTLFRGKCTYVYTMTCFCICKTR